MTEADRSAPHPHRLRAGHFTSSRLRLHYSQSGAPDAPTLLLLHGFRDHSRSWDWVAEALGGRYNIIAPDLRGHGDSGWAMGGPYVFDDFIYDLHRLLDHLAIPSIAIVAHSMGGAIALDFAGIFPNRVQYLLAIEGTWQLERPIPPPQHIDQIITGWTAPLDQLAAKPERGYPSIEAARQRLMAENPRLSDAQTSHLALHGLKQTPSGGYVWKYDPYVRLRGPSRISREDTALLWSRIRCPLTLVHGSESSMGNPHRTGLAPLFGAARIEQIQGAGHWAHHENFSAFMDLLRDDLGR